MDITQKKIDLDERQLVHMFSQTKTWPDRIDELKSKGWELITLDKAFSKSNGTEITGWMFDNCSYLTDQNVSSGVYMFESKKDLMWFKMRWLS